MARSSTRRSKPAKPSGPEPVNPDPLFDHDADRAAFESQFGSFVFLADDDHFHVLEVKPNQYEACMYVTTWQPLREQVVAEMRRAAAVYLHFAEQIEKGGAS